MSLTGASISSVSASSDDGLRPILDEDPPLRSPLSIVGSGNWKRPLIPISPAFQPYLDATTTVLTVLLFLAPASMFFRLWRTKQSLKMPPLNLVGQCCNTYNWILYGWGIHSHAVTMPNYFGLATGILWSVLYAVYVDEQYWPRRTTSFGALPFKHNFKLQYFLEVGGVGLVWLAPWVLRYSVDTAGWVSVGFDCLFLSAPAWVLWEVAWEWRADNTALMGSLTMNVVAFTSCLAWLFQFLMFVPEMQMFWSNALGCSVAFLALLLRALKPARGGRGSVGGATREFDNGGVHRGRSGGPLAAWERELDRVSGGFDDRLRRSGFLDGENQGKREELAVRQSVASTVDSERGVVDARGGGTRREISITNEQ